MPIVRLDVRLHRSTPRTLHVHSQQARVSGAIKMATSDGNICASVSIIAVTTMSVAIGKNTLGECASNYALRWGVYGLIGVTLVAFLLKELTPTPGTTIGQRAVSALVWGLLGGALIFVVAEILCFTNVYTPHTSSLYARNPSLLAGSRRSGKRHSGSGRRRRSGSMMCGGSAYEYAGGRHSASYY